MYVFMLQILNSVIDDLDLLLDHGHSHREIIVLRDAAFELFDPVRRQLRAYKDPAQRTAERSDQADDRYNNRTIHLRHPLSDVLARYDRRIILHPR